jgi:hypothetical protein
VRLYRPAYNTGNENWVYNDPRIRKWLGEVVGKEAEDLCINPKPKGNKPARL